MILKLYLEKIVGVVKFGEMTFILNIKKLEKLIMKLENFSNIHIKI